MEGQGREKKRPPRRGEPARLQVEGSPHSASTMQKGTTPRGAAGVDTSSPLPQHQSPSTSSSQRARASRLRTVPRRERGGGGGGRRDRIPAATACVRVLPLLGGEGASWRFLASFSGSASGCGAWRGGGGWVVGWEGGGRAEGEAGRNANSSLLSRLRSPSARPAPLRCAAPSPARCGVPPARRAPHRRLRAPPGCGERGWGGGCGGAAAEGRRAACCSAALRSG